MSKEQFLDTLRKKLNILKEAEIDDILLEYEQHINDEITAGKSEEEAVENFGDVGELARDILDAYQLKTDVKNKTVGKIVKKCVAFDEELLSVITSLPKGVGFSQKFSLFMIYTLIWSIIMVTLIFLSELTGKVLGFLGGFGLFLNIIFIMFWSMMMLYTLLRVMSHVWKKRK